MYSSAYPELYKHDHSLLVYFTFHTIWVLFRQCGYFSIECLANQRVAMATRTRDSAIHNVIVFNFFFSGEGAPPLPRPNPRLIILTYRR